MHVSWSPDGKTIAFADSPFPGSHKRLQLLSLDTLQSTPIEHDEKCVEEVLPAFSPDGKQLAYACSLASHQGEFGLSIVTAAGRTSGWMKGLGQGDAFFRKAHWSKFPFLWAQKLIRESGARERMPAS